MQMHRARIIMDKNGIKRLEAADQQLHYQGRRQSVHVQLPAVHTLIRKTSSSASLARASSTPKQPKPSDIV